MPSAVTHPVRTPLLAVLVALAATSPLARPAHAQGRAALDARVLDSTGAPVPGALVRVPQLARALPTDAQGHLRLDSLPAGRFMFIAEARGFIGARKELELAEGTPLEVTFELRPSAHVLEAVLIRARSRPRLPDKLKEFAIRRDRGVGRFLDPDQMARSNGKELIEALRPIVVGTRFQRNSEGVMSLISARTLNVPTSMGNSGNVKSCGVQVWQDGVLLSDPNSSADLALPDGPTSRSVRTMHVGADKSVDVFGTLTDNYMAAEYYPDVATTPPGFRTVTASCGVLVLWTRVPMREPTATGSSPSSEASP